MFAKPTRIAWIILIFWLVPHSGKKAAPQWFGSAPVQYTAAIIVAILVPIGTLMALHRLSFNTGRRVAFGFLLACLAPLIFNVTVFTSMGPLLARSSAKMAEYQRNGHELLAKIQDKALNADSAETRKIAAGLAYHLHGVRVLWLDEADGKIAYEPSEKDEENWQTTRSSEATTLAVQKQLAFTREEMAWLLMLDLGTFALIVLGGLGWTAFRRMDTTT